MPSSIPPRAFYWQRTILVDAESQVEVLETRAANADPHIYAVIDGGKLCGLPRRYPEDGTYSRAWNREVAP